MSVEAETAAPRPRRSWLVYLPLVVFMALAWLLFQRLGAGDPASIPSVLIGQSAPPLNLAGLDGAPGLTDADLRAGHVSVVNVFGSWCEPCHFEHPYLMALAADPELKAKGVAIYGVAQKDSAENIRRFLGAKGDPYAKVGLDQDNRAGIDWGVYGVPETFIVKGRRQAGVQACRPDHCCDARERAQAADPQGDELARNQSAGFARSKSSPPRGPDKTARPPWRGGGLGLGLDPGNELPDADWSNPLRALCC